MSVLIYAENADGKFKKSVFEAVSYAKAVAEQTHTQLVALSIGEVSSAELSQLAQYGANKIIRVYTDQLKNFNNQAYASIIGDVAKNESADIIILSNSFSGKGLAPRLALKLEASLADGALSLPDLSEGKFLVKKQAFSAKALAWVSLSSEIKVISLTPNSYQVTEHPENVVVEDFNPANDPKDFTTIIKEIVRLTNKVSLPDAEIIVSAGRGLKGPENWGMIEELAQLLGAATACSKPVSDAGWRPHSEHVGQTGIAVSPNLYIAIGISGAIQHLAGVSSSKVIVVINNDPGAPFFKVADYGIVGDAFEVVPSLIHGLKAYNAS